QELRLASARLFLDLEPERKITERHEDNALVCIRRATDAVEGLAHGVGALEAGGAAAVGTVEQILPDAARQLSDVLGFGGTDRRSFDVAAGVDEGSGSHSRPPTSRP